MCLIRSKGESNSREAHPYAPSLMTIVRERFIAVFYEFNIDYQLAFEGGRR